MTPPLVLLHGALGAADQMAPLAERLADSFDVHLFDLPGHGPSDARRHATLDGMTEAVLGYLGNLREAAHCFGYSLGGYVALLAARTAPRRVRNVVTLGTKFAWDPATADRERRFLDPETIRTKVPAFQRLLAARHTGLGWEAVLGATDALLADLGRSPRITPEWCADLRTPVRIMVGDRDGTVSLEESAGMARALPQGALEVLPNTPHPFEKADPARLARSIREACATH